MAVTDFDTRPKAVELYRVLADADPTAHQPFLAHALSALASAQHQAGLPGEAVTTTTRPCVEVGRVL
jgi:hypothetical protein